MSDARPIGLFDSGLGGLTVYRALRKILPHENLVYFGDTLHLPYGSKSKAEIEAYTLAAAKLLLKREIKFFAIACNTVSAQAMDALNKYFPDLPFCGVISAGAEQAARASQNGRIAVLATEGTVRSGVYPDMIRALRKDAEIDMLACPDMVTLVEEGRLTGERAEKCVASYLSKLTAGYDTLVLGCTHFPLLLPVIQKLAPGVKIIDSADATAHSVSGYLSARGMLNIQKNAGTDCFIVSADQERFMRLGGAFLGFDIAERVDFEKAV